MKICPLCNKNVSDFLQHISIIHNIKTIEEFESKVQIINEKKIKQKKFSDYVDSLKKRIAAGELSNEGYRELITKWVDENHW